MAPKGILELLKERPVVGDGGFVLTLERRGYVMAGPYTPEAVVEHPDAVEQLHKEYLRAGADVAQAFTFYASDGKIQMSDTTTEYTCEELNQAACDIALKVARPAGALVCGPLSPTPTYNGGKGDKAAVQAEFRKQFEIYVKNKVDFLLAEFIGYVEEAEWAIEVLKTSGMPVACTLRIGPMGDLAGVSPGECAVRMARAGADILGINCQFDPFTCNKTIKLMKDALDEAGLHPYLMLQPLGFHVPETVNNPHGYTDLPECPLGLESRTITRFDVHRWVREAYEIGVRYFGGCCGFEAYHIREISAALAEERGFREPGADKYVPWGGGLSMSVMPQSQAKVGQEYWSKLKPACGRPECCKPLGIKGSSNGTTTATNGVKATA